MPLPRKYIDAVVKISDCKWSMIARRLRRAKAHCPICDGKNTLQLALAPQSRDRSGYHIQWSCSKCKYSGME